MLDGLVTEYVTLKILWVPDNDQAHIQLFRERLSEKPHASIIPKGIVGGFEITSLQRNLQERYRRPWTYACEC